MTSLRSKLDANQVLRDSYDESLGRLRVDAEVTASIGTVDVIIDAATGDNVAIGDSTGANSLAVNPDGSINVVIDSTPGLGVNKYNEVLAVASGAAQVINTYTVPAGKTASLTLIDVSGDNIAKYIVKIDGIPQDQKRTYFGNSFNLTFDFQNNLLLNPGQVVSVEVHNFRPTSSDFNSKILVLEYT